MTSSDFRKWVAPAFFMAVMTHPLIPTVRAIAEPLAREFGLELVEAVFHTHCSPPVLRLDVRNLNDDTSLNDCERMSRALEARLDADAVFPDAYVLEISSPGLSTQLSDERDFTSFKGFPVRVSAHTPHKGKTEWRGRLQGRDDDTVYVNQKGRVVKIPRSAIAAVELDSE